MDLIDSVSCGEVGPAIGLLDMSTGYRIYDQCNIFGMGALHTAARRDGMIGVLAEKAPVSCLSTERKGPPRDVCSSECQGKSHPWILQVMMLEASCSLGS
jgi:hypothetical protein